MAGYLWDGATWRSGSHTVSPSVTPQPSGSLLVPSNVRMKGANATMGFYNGYPSDPAHSSAEAGSWVNFQFAQWWQPLIDDTAALGANCLRIWGSVQPVNLGGITLATYLSRWETVLSYCETKGIYVYATGGAFGSHWAGTDAQNIQLYTDWASMLATHANVIGVDIANESWSQAANDPTNAPHWLTLCGQLIDAVHTAGLPAATSNRGVTNSSGGWTIDVYNGVAWHDFIVIGDWVDFHVYDPYTYTQMQAFYNHPQLGPAAGNKEVFFGEFGTTVSGAYSPVRTTLYPAMKNLILAHPRHVGGTCWAIWDFTNNVDWLYGLYALSSFPPGTRTLRHDQSDVFATFPVTR